MAEQLTVAVIHADESCLGNDRSRESPGGAAALIETQADERILRRDLYLAARGTTNNRMALNGAIAALALLKGDGSDRFRVAYVSDSQYLVHGMNEWVAAWRARGWKRRGGKVENLELWKTLVRVAGDHQPTFIWVRGHAGNPKNEYANDLAIRAATEQETSRGAVLSGFDAWLGERRARKQFVDFDPDAEFSRLVNQLNGPP